MTLFEQFDMMARGGSLALLALWSWLLIRDHRGVLAARMAILMNGAIVCHIGATMPVPIDESWFDLPLELGSVTVPALFWLFARTWFNDEQRVGWRGWLAVAASMVMLAVLLAHEGTRGPPFYVAAALLRVSMFGFAVAGLWVAWRGRDNDLVEARRRLRVRLVAGVGLYVIFVNLVEVFVFNDLIAGFWRSLIEMGIALMTFAFCATMFALRQADMLAPPQAAASGAKRPAATDDDPLIAKLTALMAAELPHRDEGLTIAMLAARLGEQEYRLRRAINGGLGFRNFAQFLNSYRLAEVKAALTDPAQRDVPILTIALDAGFGSLGPFNRAFRDAEGMTPSEFRARSL